MEEDSSCEYDWLQIDNGSKIDATGEKLCGNIERCEERIIHSNEGGLSLSFHSDFNIVHKGFHITFEIIGKAKGTKIKTYSVLYTTDLSKNDPMNLF